MQMAPFQEIFTEMKVGIGGRTDDGRRKLAVLPARSLLATPPFFMALSADCEDGGSRSNAEFHNLSGFRSQGLE